MEHGTPVIKAEIKGVERSPVDTGSDVSILQSGISKASIRDTTLRPLSHFAHSGATLGPFPLSVSLPLHPFLVYPAKLSSSHWTLWSRVGCGRDVP